MEWRTIRLEDVSLTNDYTRSIAEKSPKGTVVIAKDQPPVKTEKVVSGPPRKVASG
ncbi:hypothetical protein [Thermococcus gorgonarius]|uniref:hypothetical protein n=1 Tax=Thermococcus gorgonarius TaxID=71997 RepID=UPI0012FD6CB5|nr:hypothetical protein [Thermococcus gorgonarius]